MDNECFCKVCNSKEAKYILFLPSRVFIPLCPKHLIEYNKSGTNNIIKWLNYKGVVAQ